MTELPPGMAVALANRPACMRIVEAVLRTWPEHARYVEKSFAARSKALLDTTEVLAEAALKLAGGRLHQIAAHYRWTCDRLRDEELNFHRTGRYRLSTFAEADAEVYSNAAYMEKYVDGLLLSQILWFNHSASCDFFLRGAPALLGTGQRFLEIGPGHGLMTYLALRDFGLSEVVAWDLSPVSVEQTRAALALLGFKNVTFDVRDMMSVESGEDIFDLVVLSEILEHLEDPKAAMRKIHGLVQQGGLVFVNVPINSPSPDHLHLMETLDDARALLTETGFEIVSEAFFATQNTKVERALKTRVSISACMFARARQPV